MSVEMVGTTSKPVPRHQSDHVPAEIKEDGSPTKVGEEDGVYVEANGIPTEEDGSTDPDTKRSNVGNCGQLATNEG